MCASREVRGVSSSAKDVAQSATSSLPATSKHRDLIRWVLQHGGYLHPDIFVTFDPAKGHHVLVRKGKSIAKNTRIASCPMESTLSILNPLDIHPFACHGTKFPQRFLDEFCETPEILQTFFLMEQFLEGDKSWWAYYISTLPTPNDIKDLQFETSDDRVWIQGTNLAGAREIQLDKWRENYTKGLQGLTSNGWENATKGRLTWELFRWATTIFGTRSFTSQVLSDTTAADIARPLGRQQPDHAMLSKLFSERFAVLLPLLDILNHKPVAQIEWQARHSFVGLEVQESYTELQELFNNYGPRDNESLLLCYGFVLENNPFDHIAVSIQVPLGSPLADARTWPIDIRSNEHFNCYIFGPDHPLVTDSANLERAFFSYDLLDSISVLTANDRELQMMYGTQKTLMSTFLGEQFLDYRNLLGTITQLLQDCRARAQRLQDSDPAEMQPPPQPRTQKQRYAQIYRASQLRILQNAIAVCTFIIFHACSNLQPAEIISTMEARVPQFSSPDIHSVTDRMSCLCTHNELVTVDDILRLLPGPMSMSLENGVQEITQALQRLENVPTIHSDIIKSGFALALSGICCEYLGGFSFGPRLDSWFEHLVHWYPPTDENWCWIPQPPPWPPGEEPPRALVQLLAVTGPALEQLQARPENRLNQWLRPEMLCWGWNVMEEEGVIVPIEIERYCNGIVEAAIEEGAIGFMMYCKQL